MGKNYRRDYMALQYIHEQEKRGLNIKVDTALICASVLFLILFAFSGWVQVQLHEIDVTVAESRAELDAIKEGLSELRGRIDAGREAAGEGEIGNNPQALRASSFRKEPMPGADKPAEAAPVYPLTDAERDIIAAICFFEDRSGGGMGGMAAVAEVIFNRLSDGRFGENVAEVCTPSQFHGLRQLGTLPITEDAYTAVRAVFDEGTDAGTLGALYFCTGSPDNIKPGLREVARIGGHVFYID